MRAGWCLTTGSVGWFANAALADAKADDQNVKISFAACMMKTRLRRDENVKQGGAGNSNVAQPSTAAGSSNVPLRDLTTGDEVPHEPAGGDACATRSSNRLVRENRKADSDKCCGRRREAAHFKPGSGELI
jgi:hypothetical protein